MGRIGVMFRPEWPPEDLPAFARGAEAGGFDELWLVEDCFLAGGPTMAAVALGATERIGVGIGLLPAAVRNPAIAAMEIAGLARVYPGRLTVTFGHGVEAWMRQIGARPPDRLALLEAVVGTVRALLDGEEVLDGVRLEHLPDERPRVLVGTIGPRALKLAGRLADGFLLVEGSGPAMVRWARETAGAGEAVVYAWLSVDDDRDAAAEALRPGLEQSRARYPKVFEVAGANGDQLTLDQVRGMSVSGDPEDCARAVQALWDAGAASVVLVPHGDAVERFTAEVRPLLG
jgi:alkanesulfonate monooxygenase SsuD/methylene tetrahydromethanopterin reductase-like flavin-dependent oxidoreductase (luciferase family)